MIKKNHTQVMVMILLIFVGFSSHAQDRFGGVSLFTVRNEMDTDPKGTLKKVADIGYKYIEAADYKEGKFYGMAPEAFNKELSDLGLTPLSVHMGSATLDNIDVLIADTKAAGFKYFIAPVPPMGLFKYDFKTKSISMSDDLETLTNILNTMGLKCKAAGLEFLYHNHGSEFEENKNGVIPIVHLLENLNAKYVNFQMDLYWVAKAGADPIAYFEQYPGRFIIWHVKDMDDQGRFAPVGEGSIDFQKILMGKDAAGMKYYLVEQDQTFDGLAPLDAIKISHEGLKKIGFN